MSLEMAQALTVRIRQDEYLNSGESYTGMVIAMLMVGNPFGKASLDAVMYNSNLSEGTVRKHVKRLEQRGHIVRHGHIISLG